MQVARIRGPQVHHGHRAGVGVEGSCTQTGADVPAVTEIRVPAVVIGARVHGGQVEVGHVPVLKRQAQHVVARPAEARTGQRAGGGFCAGALGYTCLLKK